MTESKSYASKQIQGVGSFVVEGLIRAGIGNLVMIDPDNISITNLNRQLHAMHSTLEKSKVEVMKQRVLDINPNIKVEVYKGTRPMPQLLLCASMPAHMRSARAA